MAAPSGRINWIHNAADRSKWCPNANDGEMLLAEANHVAAQLGQIPQSVYQIAGAPQDGLFSIEEMMQGRVEPAPGKFAVIQRHLTWIEALLCMPIGDSGHW